LLVVVYHPQFREMVMAYPLFSDEIVEMKLSIHVYMFLKSSIADRTGKMYLYHRVVGASVVEMIQQRVCPQPDRERSYVCMKIADCPAL